MTDVRALFALLLALALGLTLPAAAAANHDHRKVYVFSLDGLDGAEVDGGMAPFMSGLKAGEHDARTTFYPNSRSVMFSETNPNHTSMITGAFPSRHGIASNEFAQYGEPADEDSCDPKAPDFSKEPFATSGEDTRCVGVPNLFETIEKRRNPKHITTAMIMGKPKLARQFATRRANDPGYDADYVWAPCADDDAFCDSSIPRQPVTNYSAADSFVMDEVIRTTREKVLDRGRKRRPDFTFVNFPQIDSAGHVFGRNSVEYQAAIALMDLEIQRFVENQKELGIWDRTILLIVSDHSMEDTVVTSKVVIEDYLDAGGVPADKYEIVANAGNQAFVYLNDRLAPDADQTRKQIRDALAGGPGIEHALYTAPNPVDGDSAHVVPDDWGMGGPRAGDIAVTTVAGIGVYETSEASSVPFNPFQGGHGAEHTRDNTFMVTGGHRAIKQKSAGVAASNVDVAATAFKLLNRKPAKTVDGSFRREAFKNRQLKKESNPERQGGGRGL